MRPACPCAAGHLRPSHAPRLPLCRRPSETHVPRRYSCWFGSGRCERSYQCKASPARPSTCQSQGLSGHSQVKKLTCHWSAAGQVQLFTNDFENIARTSALVQSVSTIWNSARKYGHNVDISAGRELCRSANNVVRKCRRVSS